MARAKLHIICGNCGSNDEFEFKIDPKGHDISDEVENYEKYRNQPNFILDLLDYNIT